MASFSSILSSIGQPKPAGQPLPATAVRPQQNEANKQSSSTFAKPAALAGTKRKSAEPETNPRPKVARTTSSPAQPPSARFQLSKTPAARSAASVATPAPRSPAKATSSTAAPSTTTQGPGQKRGFASILAKAAAAQAAATSQPGTIKHVPTKHLSVRERRQLAEQQRANQSRSRSRSGTPNAAANRPLTKTTGQRTDLAVDKPKKEKRDLGYSGTMRAHQPGASSSTIEPSSKASPGRKDEYVDWSDLDEVDDDGLDDEEEGYASDGSSDMDAGFNDLEAEELRSKRAALKEDEEALAEEERLKREKEARRRRLEGLSKAASGKGRRY